MAQAPRHRINPRRSRISAAAWPFSRSRQANARSRPLKAARASVLAARVLKPDITAVLLAHSLRWHCPKATAARLTQAGSHPHARRLAGAKPKLYNPRHPERTRLYQTIAQHLEIWFDLASSGPFDGQGDHHTPRPMCARRFANICSAASLPTALPEPLL